MIPVPVRGSAYAVHVRHGLLAESGRFLRGLQISGRVVVVTSPRVARLWSAELARGLRRAGLRFDQVTIPDGEPHKTLRTVEHLLARFAALELDRGSCVVAFGGGMVGDVAAFAASIYMRGIAVVQVPTTLLAQVDAAIGGKTGVNLAAGKNLAGTFHQPRLVLADTQTLETLTERDYRAGLFEAIKCGVVRDATLFRFLEGKREDVLARSPEALQRVIVSSARVKAAVVARDEKEAGMRRILNFGHTLGHALEAAGGYRRYRHGEAVAWGMLAAAEMGRNIGVTPPAVADRIIDVVCAYGPLPPVKEGSADILRHMRNDKKSAAGRTHFVLAAGIGRSTVVAGIPAGEIRRSLAVWRSRR